MSGHLFFSECWQGTDDALFAATRLLDCLARSLPVTAATPEVRIPCADRRKPEGLRQVAERLTAVGAQVDTTDGLRVTDPDGWWLLRAPGTEPKLTVRCEAANESGQERLRATVAGHLRACSQAWEQ